MDKPGSRMMGLYDPLGACHGMMQYIIPLQCLHMPTRYLQETWLELLRRCVPEAEFPDLAVKPARLKYDRKPVMRQTNKHFKT